LESNLAASLSRAFVLLSFSVSFFIPLFSLLLLLLVLPRGKGPPFIREMPDVNAISGETLVIHCPIGGYPISETSWKKGYHRRIYEPIPINIHVNT
jgi:hypothetical protein